MIPYMFRFPINLSTRQDDITAHREELQRRAEPLSLQNILFAQNDDDWDDADLPVVWYLLENH